MAQNSVYIFSINAFVLEKENCLQHKENRNLLFFS